MRMLQIAIVQTALSWKTGERKTEKTWRRMVEREMKEHNLTWGKLEKTSKDVACSGVGLMCASARRGLS